MNINHLLRIACALFCATTVSTIFSAEQESSKARLYTSLVAQEASKNVARNKCNALLQSLTLREKIGQLFVAPAASCFDQPEEALATSMRKSPYKMDPDYVKMLISKYHVGGLIFLYKSTPDLQIDATNEYQKLSKTPLLITQDCEWGLSMRLYNTIRFPRNMTLGAIPDQGLIYEMGNEVGRQCKAIGVHMNFAPVVDVNNNHDNPVIHDRSFGQDPHAVAQCGLLMMRGLRDGGVTPCVKHFIGHGDTKPGKSGSKDSHVDLPVVDYKRDRLNKVEIFPFKVLIDNDVPAVMSAHLAVPAFEKDENRASSLSYSIITDLLEKELGFDGLKVTDGLGMEALTKHYAPGQIELEAFLAGNDILLCPVNVPVAVELIEQAIKEGKVTMQELDRRVMKILAVKSEAGVFDFKPIDKEKALAQLMTEHAQELKAKLYQQAITVINKKAFTPIADAKTTAVVQIGGKQESDFKQQITKTLPCTYYCQSAKGDEQESDALLAKLEGITTVIVPIFEMNKFAKQEYGLSDATLKLLAQLRALGKKTIIVPFGTPYSASYFVDATSIVVAYEDDVEAQKAAADVVVGKRIARGVLPVSIT